MPRRIRIKPRRVRVPAGARKSIGLKFITIILYVTLKYLVDKVLFAPQG